MDGTPERGLLARPTELTAMGLDVPQAAAIAQALRERGAMLPGNPSTPSRSSRPLVVPRCRKG